MYLEGLYGLLLPSPCVARSLLVTVLVILKLGREKYDTFDLALPLQTIMSCQRKDIEPQDLTFIGSSTLRVFSGTDTNPQLDWYASKSNNLSNKSETS
ncbi:hypothetical protein TNCV_325521 [Trichonephila clavipes]|nr:hypothetical protein TNCV_325521 [Trichonephila clavipes]